MFKLRVKIKLYWTAMINVEPDEAYGYIEGYSEVVFWYIFLNQILLDLFLLNL